MDDIYDLYTDSDYDRKLTADEVAGGDLIGGIVDISDDYDSADGTSKVITVDELFGGTENIGELGAGGNPTFAGLSVDGGNVYTDPEGSETQVGDYNNTILGVGVLGAGNRTEFVDWNVMMGWNAFYNVENTVNVVGIGANVLCNADKIAHTVVIGKSALYSVDGTDGTPEGGVVIGYEALKDISYVEDSIALGREVGRDSTGKVTRSMLLGYWTLMGKSVDVEDCTLIGNGVCGPGYDPTGTLSNLIIIGDMIDPPSDDVTSDYMSIGDFLRGDMAAGEFYQPIPNAAPDDGDLSTSEGCLHVDEANDHLAVKVQYSDNTIHTFDVASPSADQVWTGANRYAQDLEPVIDGDDEYTGSDPGLGSDGRGWNSLYMDGHGGTPDISENEMGVLFMRDLGYGYLYASFQGPAGTQRTAEVIDFNNPHTEVVRNKNGALLYACRVEEIADGDLVQREAGLYADGSNHLWIKWKDSSGTVRTLDLGEAT